MPRKKAETQDPHPEPVHSQLATTQRKEIKILRLAAENVPQNQIAKLVGVHESTVSRILSEYEDTGIAALQKLKAASLDAATNWATIAKTSKKHDAAKDLLLYSGAIQPLESDTGGAKVTINIGMPGAPVSVEPPQIIDTTAVRGDESD